MKDGPRRALAASREALPRHRPFRRRQRSRRRCRRCPSARGQAGQALPADPGCDHRNHGLAGDLRVAGRARARGIAARIDAALARLRVQREAQTAEIRLSGHMALDCTLILGMFGLNRASFAADEVGDVAIAHASHQDTEQRQGQARRRAARRRGNRRRAHASPPPLRRSSASRSCSSPGARVMQAATAETARIGELVEAVEADVALTIAVLRAANRGGSPPGGTGGIPEAIDMLKPSGVLAIAGTATVFDFFETNGGRELRPEQFRVHALATQHAAERDRPRHRLGRARRARRRRPSPRRRPARDRQLPPGPAPLLRRGRPHSRAALARRTRPARHRPRPGRRRPRPALEPAAADRRRDRAPPRRRRRGPRRDGRARRHGRPLLARARRSPPSACATPPSAAASSPDALRELLYELPYAARRAARVSEPCPLSTRELDVLRHLSEGMVYKQIAGEMQLSVSTIRTHLHNVYGKIGAVDRAQAVLTARDRGWI